jgi:hypothetical protein
MGKKNLDRINRMKRIRIIRVMKKSCHKKGYI